MSIPTLLNEIQKEQNTHKIMRWPCNHYWGSRKCNEYVDSLGAKCLDCTVCTFVCIYFPVSSRH